MFDILQMDRFELYLIKPKMYPVNQTENVRKQLAMSDAKGA
jgi:hypothetical protein